MEICVLRLGHRPERDQRVTTHVGLTARALGASGMYLAGSDKGVVQSIRDVVDRWGGDFFIEDGVSWKKCIQSWRESGGIAVHLTMYGIPLTSVEQGIRQCGKVMVIVGAEKVPGEVYGLVDYNVSVTGQPHSEIAGLAVFLDHLFCGGELDMPFSGGKISVIPCAAGKMTEEH
ncbi:MAG: tRNA (cytidine(56)-2'-O)-methyltransferase [Methanoregulaceae archaeon]|nr:tRNA (cytidine(56)-2'-O)-methyltransferase [Methanoregulaceae archaeon]